MIGAVQGSFPEDEENGRFGTKAIEAERLEQEKINETKYRLIRDTKFPAGPLSAGVVAYGKDWKQFMGGRIPPAIMDRLQETNEPASKFAEAKSE